MTRPLRQPGSEPPAAPDPRPSWDEVAERYGQRVYNLSYRLTGNPHDAADLAQDVFVRVFRNLDRYQPGTFDGWLYRVTKNLFLDRVRRERRVRLETLEPDQPPASMPEEAGPADLYERRTLEADLEDGLAALGPDFRLAVVLCDIEGLSYEEIAEATGWAMGTVRSRIHRARRQLRDSLERAAASGDAPLRRGPRHA